MTNTHTAAIWSKSSPSWGSAKRVQRNYYAYLVTVAMTGTWGTCPTCHGPLTWEDAEVDRVTPALDYTPGNIVYTCRATCNGPRGVLQSVGADWSHVDQYAHDVAVASASVEVPSITEARRWWHSRNTDTGRVSRYA